jgi:hypothetical protein
MENKSRYYILEITNDGDIGYVWSSIANQKTLASLAGGRVYCMSDIKTMQTLNDAAHKVTQDE